jgi:GDPmannose 4,6-dehydratase
MASCNKTKALVLGVNGQDGSYAAEELLRRGYGVIGTGKQTVSRYVKHDGFSYRQLDLQNHLALRDLLVAERPDVVFHFAAVHGAAGFQYEPVVDIMLAVNVAAVHVLLEYARARQPSLRIVYANSAKIFPAPWVGSIDEKSTMRPTCLYSIGKLTALELIRFYRAQHGISAANLILFNHESPRRSADFFLPMVASGLLRAKRDPAYSFAVKTLDFQIDWSSAEELMDIAVEISERAPNEDFVLASGVTQYARTVVEALFARNGLNAANHVHESLPPAAVLPPSYSVQLARLRERIGRVPQRTIESIIDEMIATARVE